VSQSWILERISLALGGGFAQVRNIHSNKVGCPIDLFCRLLLSQKGRVFADHSMYLTFVTVLATVHILKAKNAQGEEITPTIEFERGGDVTSVFHNFVARRACLTDALIGM
jgi:hypothetical protein